MEGLIFLIVAGFFYFLPTLAATGSKHRNAGAIFATNLLLGWTVIGWIVAMIWACTSSKPQAVAVTVAAAEPAKTMMPPAEERPCPHCAETIKAEAKICRYCHQPVEPLPALRPFRSQRRE